LLIETDDGIPIDRLQHAFGRWEREDVREARRHEVGRDPRGRGWRAGLWETRAREEEGRPKGPDRGYNTHSQYRLQAGSGGHQHNGCGLG